MKTMNAKTAGQVFTVGQDVSWAFKKIHRAQKG